jgi:hypothetical protein
MPTAPFPALTTKLRKVACEPQVSVSFQFSARFAWKKRRDPRDVFPRKEN